MRITLLAGATCTPDRGRVVDIAAVDFLDDMGLPEGSASLQCVDQAAKLAGPGFVLAQYRPGATDKLQASLDPASSTDVLCYDIDQQTRASVDAAWQTWAQHDAAIYSTMKHTPAEPRIRLLLRLSRPVANASGDEYPRLYAAVAGMLGIDFDPSTKDRARFFFGPQHRPGLEADCWRFRFKGVALAVDEILATAPAVAAAATPASAPTGPRRLPDAGELGRVTGKLLRSTKPEAQSTGAVLEAVLAGRAFAESGGIHLASRDLAFALVRDVPLFDGDGFAAKWLKPCWDSMEGASVEERTKNWLAAVDSAATKLASVRVADAGLYPTISALGMSDDDVEAARACGGALVNEFRGNYYVWDCKGRRYVGPVKGTGLSAACREGLQGLPGFEYRQFGKGGGSLKSGPKLVEEFGYRLAAVDYWAVPPSSVFDLASMTVQIPAYHCNAWAGRAHTIVDELLRALGGPQLPRLLAWLAKFTDLEQPLPALVLVGPRGVWKSRIAQILARFWGSSSAGSPCRASQVLGRFSRPLLGNPVIHTDEAMARSESGKAIPEVYRESIMSRVHTVEAKGVDPVTLHTATRHVISVNDLDQVFGGGEVDASSVEATVERYLVVDISGAEMAAFESRWAGTAELDALREGTPLLEHVVWLTSVSSYRGTCRLWVDTGTDADVLLRARFADDTLVMCMGIAVEALLAEPRMSKPGQIARLPLILDENGRLRLSPARIVDLWADSRLTAGSGLRKPTAQRVGRILQKAGLKQEANERACDSRKWQAWAVNHERLREYLHVEGAHTWSEIERACEMVFGNEIGVGVSATFHLDSPT